MSRGDREGARLYIGRLSRSCRTRDLDDAFSRYGRLRDVDIKSDFAFVEYYDSRDADDAVYYMNGRDVAGSRITVEFARRRGGGGSRYDEPRGPTPGTGRCYNCGKEGHWARDCKSGDWSNKCYKCGDRGHIERNCPNPDARYYSRSPSPSYRGSRRDRSPSYGRRSRSYSYSPRNDRRLSRSPSPYYRGGRGGGGGGGRGRSRSRGRSYSRSPSRSVSRSRSPRRNRSVTPRRDSRSPVRKDSRSRSPVRKDSRSRSPVRKDSRSPVRKGSAEPMRKDSRSPSRGRSLSPVKRDDSRSPRPMEDKEEPLKEDVNGADEANGKEDVENGDAKED